MADSVASSHPTALPHLSAAELPALKPLAVPCSYNDSQIVFRAGDADLDLFVVESGAIEIVNPADGTVDEVAALVAFVAGPEASYITGANLTVDGGTNA
jgi:NAD(P)-dependent dehydrogenase (short-subunit alcohol dehydrogenase family)